MCVCVCVCACVYVIYTCSLLSMPAEIRKRYHIPLDLELSAFGSAWYMCRFQTLVPRKKKKAPETAEPSLQLPFLCIF